MRLNDNQPNSLMPYSHRRPDTTRRSCLCRDCLAKSQQSSARRTATQTRHRTHRSGCRADSIHTATSDTTKQSCLCRVWRGGVNWTIARYQPVQTSNILSATVMSCRESNTEQKCADTIGIVTVPVPWVGYFQC